MFVTPESWNDSRACRSAACAMDQVTRRHAQELRSAHHGPGAPAHVGRQVERPPHRFAGAVDRPLHRMHSRFGRRLDALRRSGGGSGGAVPGVLDLLFQGPRLVRWAPSGFFDLRPARFRFALADTGFFRYDNNSLRSESPLRGEAQSVSNSHDWSSKQRRPLSASAEKKPAWSNLPKEFDHAGLLVNGPPHGRVAPQLVIRRLQINHLSDTI
jgi:hypothetical protein